jgi:hypothetical protein
MSFQGDKISMSPSFIGTQPQAFTIRGRHFRPLAGEVDDAYLLVNSLSDEQRKLAVISPRRGNIVTGPGTDGKYPQPTGLPCKSFTQEQQQLLQKLISHWVNVLPETQSAAERDRLAKTIEEMHFTWNGALSHGSDISYAIHSPTMIIEYACQGNANQPLEHLHSMYRNPQDEYGGQLEK